MKKIYTIGRDESCDIVINDSTDIMSRLHATVRVEPNGKIFITDQSRNGTYVNGMKMSSNVEVPVTRKDVVSFAKIQTLDWSRVPSPKKRILKVSLILLVVLCILGGLAYMLINNHIQKPSKIQPGADTVIVVKPDTLVVVDTVIVETEVVKEKVVEKTVPEEKIEEPEKIYDPVY